IEHGVGHVIEVVSRYIAVDQALEDRRNKENDTPARILQDRQQFLAHEGEDAEVGVEHGGPQASFLCVTARAKSSSVTAIAASTDALGRMTPQTSPARNSVCNRAT